VAATAAHEAEEMLGLPGTPKQQLLAAARNAALLLLSRGLDGDPVYEALAAAIERAEGQPKPRTPRAPRQPCQPRQGSKEALVIDMLRRPERDDRRDRRRHRLAAAHHSRVLRRRLKKRHGLQVTSEKPEKDQPRVYRVPA
jgi:hypothetical protein